MSARKCGACGKDPAAGFASVNGVFFCHEDDGTTCYMEAQSVDAYEPRLTADGYVFLDFAAIYAELLQTEAASAADSETEPSGRGSDR